MFHEPVGDSLHHGEIYHSSLTEDLVFTVFISVLFLGTYPHPPWYDGHIYPSHVPPYLLLTMFNAHLKSSNTQIFPPIILQCVFNLSSVGNFLKRFKTFISCLSLCSTIIRISDT